MGTPPSPSPPERHSRLDLVLALGLFGMLAVFFLPLTLWVVDIARNHAQLLQSLGILGLAGTALLMENRNKVQLRAYLSRRVLALLTATFLLAGTALLLRWPLPLFAAYATAVGAAALFVFGDRAQKAVLPLMIAFAGWIGWVYLFPVLDWPLRVAAGQWSNGALSLLGLGGELSLAREEGAVLLLLTVQGQVFEVAAECNGFGLLSSGFLLALLLVLYRKLGWMDRGLYMVTALLIAFLGNILRIVFIVLLAPVVGAENYWTMHEVVGTAVYLAALGGIALLISSHGIRHPR